MNNPNTNTPNLLGTEREVDFIIPGSTLLIIAGSTLGALGLYGTTLSLYICLGKPIFPLCITLSGASTTVGSGCGLYGLYLTKKNGQDASLTAPLVPNMR